MSVGIAVYPENGTTNETLFQAADRALCRVKHPKNTL
jgi:GGDEF domain-containing protein